MNNLLKKTLTPKRLQNLLLDLYSLDNLKIIDVAAEEYLSAISMVSETGLDVNDCLAIKVMRDWGIDEIYSFDKGFDGFVTRLPEKREF